MNLTTCNKKHCWGASVDNGMCNRHSEERIAELEAELEYTKTWLSNATPARCEKLEAENKALLEGIKAQDDTLWALLTESE